MAEEETKNEGLEAPSEEEKSEEETKSEETSEEAAEEKPAEEDEEETEEKKGEGEEEKPPEETSETAEEEKPEGEKKEELQDEKKYPYPGLNLMNTMKIALEALKEKKYDAVASLLKSVISKASRKESAPSVLKEVGDVKHIEQAKDLLKKAGDELKLKDARITQMSSDVERLGMVEEKYDDLLQKQKLSLVDSLIKKEESLGLVSKEEVKDKQKIYSKLSGQEIKRLTETLSNKKPVALKKESLKGEESKREELSKEKLKVIEAMKIAGLRKETIEEYSKQ